MESRSSHERGGWRRCVRIRVHRHHERRCLDLRALPQDRNAPVAQLLRPYLVLRGSHAHYIARRAAALNLRYNWDRSPFPTGDVMAEAKNLLPWLSKLRNVEDCDAIAAALGTGPSGCLTKYDYYRSAGRDLFDHPGRLGWLDLEKVKGGLRKYPFWPQARETLRKLETPPPKYDE